MMLWRSRSCQSNKEPSNCHPSRSSSSSSQVNMLDYLPTLPVDCSPPPASPLTWRRLSETTSSLFSLLRSLLISPKCTCIDVLSPPTLCRPRSRHVTGTLFGNRKGHVTFAVQDHPNSPPKILIQLPSSTTALVKEMSSGLLRIALECTKSSTRTTVLRLQNEPKWTMYCNGQKCATYAAARTCSDSDLRVFQTIQSVSAGAGVIPRLDDVKVGGDCDVGELVYMRARFERVIGTRDSEAFYMLNPDGHGGPDLSIFLLRI